MRPLLFPLMLAASTSLAFGQSASLAELPVFDLPRLEGVVIDGNTADWANHGFCVEILSAVDRDQPDRRDLSGSFRAAWSEAGLLLAVVVRDLYNQEAANPAKLYEGDSLEVFVSTNDYNGSEPAAEDRNHLQAVFAPGLSDTYPELRTFLYDHRSPAVRSKVPDTRVLAARMSRVNGYQLEALIPWSNLGFTPREGAVVGLQLHLNNTGGPTGSSRFIWNATPGLGHRVRLAATASATVNLAASARFENYDSLRIELASPVGTEHSVTLSDGERIIATPKLTPRADGLLTAQINLPVSADNSPPCLYVQDAGRPLAVLPLPPVAEVRKKALDLAGYEIPATIFSGDTFPSGAWSRPQTLTDLLGPDFTTTVTYYDAEARPVTAPAADGRYAAVVVASSDKNSRRIHRFVTLCRVPFASPDLKASTTAAVVASRLEAASDPTAPSARTAEQNLRYRVLNAQGLEIPFSTVVLKPEGYDKLPEKRWPLLLFLHGSGRGTQAWADIEPARIFLQKHRDYPLLLVQLLASEGPWTPRKVLDQLTTLQFTYRIDPDRIYLVGFSMGGAGTWSALAAAPHTFAAAVPISSRAEVSTAPLLTHIPIWAFHGDIDFVDATSVITMIDTLRAAGGDARLTRLRNTDHVQAPLTALEEPDVYDWLLQQRRPATPPSTP